MRQFRFSIQCLLFLALTAGLLSAGWPAYADRVVLKGGTTLIGTVTRESESQVSLEIEGGGSMTLPRSLIESLEITETASAGRSPATAAATPVSILIVVPTATPSATATALAAKPSATAELTPEEIEKIGQGRPLFGKTRDTVGIVEVKRPGKDWEETPTDTVLFEGDELRTQNGRTKIFVDRPEQQTEIRVKENSGFSVPAGESTITIDLQKGKVWSRLKSLTDAEKVKFRIRTPNAIAGVRGTLFYAEMLPKDSKFAVFEGKVEVIGRTRPELSRTVDRLKAVRVSVEEQFSSLLDVDPNEIKEWEEWDEWAKQTKADLAPYVAGVPGAKRIVDAQIDQVAAEGKLYSQMAAEANRLVLRNRQSEKMESVKRSVLRYTEHVGHLPAEDYGLTYLQNNIESSPQWQGPYLDPEFSLPIRDLWGKEITYRIQVSPTSGNVYAELISNGPNRLFNDGKGDDLRVLIVPRQP